MGDSKNAVKPMRATDKKLIITVAIGIVAIIVIAFWGSFNPSKKSVSTSPKYVETLQSEVKSLIEQIDGVGSSSVMITLKPDSQSIQGVLIVCEGGDNPIIEHKVTTAVKTVLGIGSNNVCVVY